MCPEQEKVPVQGKFRQWHLIGVTAGLSVVKAGKHHVHLNSNARRVPFSPAQYWLPSCEQTLIHQSLGSPASDDVFHFSAAPLLITGSLISLPVISGSRMSWGFVGHAPFPRELLSLALHQQDIPVTFPRIF